MVRINRKALRARLDLVAAEYALPAGEVEKAKTNDDALIDLAQRHNLSLDWLVCGDLRDRLRQARWRSGYPRMID